MGNTRGGEGGSWPGDNSRRILAALALAIRHPSGDVKEAVG